MKERENQMRWLDSITLIFTNRRNRQDFPNKTVLRIARTSQKSSEKTFRMLRRLVSRSKQIDVPSWPVRCSRPEAEKLRTFQNEAFG